MHEQAVRASQLVQTKYQRIIANTPGMVYQFVRRVRGEAEFLFVSDACHNLLGLEPAALLRDPDEYFRMVHPEDEPMRRSAVAAALATLEAVSWEGRHILPTGETARASRRRGYFLGWCGVGHHCTQGF